MGHVSHIIMYEEFLENEKACASEMFRNMVVEIEFDEDEYLFIKELDGESLAKIIDMIDDIIGVDDKRLRYLIFGDFIFTVSGCENADPTNIVCKISRSDYISKILFRASIATLFGYKYYDYIEHHKKLLIGVSIENVGKKTVVRSFGDSWVSIVYFQFKFIEFPVNRRVYGPSKIPFVMRTFFGSKYSFSSFRNI